MQVRRALAHEVDDIASVWWRSRLDAVPDVPLPVHTEDEVHEWFAKVVIPTREVWVAEHDGAVKGLLVIKDEWIDQLYVNPADTGHGLGSRLLTVAKRQRPCGLKLWTFAANVRARHFYESHGFVATGSTDGDNEEGAPDIRYEWPSDGPAR